MMFLHITTFQPVIAFRPSLAEFVIQCIKSKVFFFRIKGKQHYHTETQDTNVGYKNIKTLANSCLLKSEKHCFIYF